MRLSPAFLSHIRFFQLLTFQRLRNIFLVYISYGLTRLSGRIVNPPHPVSLSIEPTNLCNLRCSQCPTGNVTSGRKKSVIELDLFTEIISQVAPKSIWLNLYFQGEPMMVPEFFQMLGIAKKQQLFVCTSTNGHFLDEISCNQLINLGLDKIIISLDGLSQQTYETYRRNGDLKKVLTGIETLVQIRQQHRVNHPFIEVQFLVFSHNQHEIPAMKRYAENSGIDQLSIKSVQVYDLKNQAGMIPSIESYSRYKKNAEGNFAIKSHFPNHCFKMWSSTVITADGQVIPCCFDKELSFPMDNIRNKPFLEIWKSQQYESFRRKLFSGRKEIPICVNCSEGLE
jgi:radical SAM protein with 4Fe4S-binding SPASM domain